MLQVNKDKVEGFEAFTAVMLQGEVFWIVTQCHVVVEYRRFGGPYCLHLHLHPESGSGMDI
jgi:hypothetical protein